VTLLIASTVYGRTIHVPADQPTIQAGIDAALNGDTVLVSAGTYVENIDFKGKAIIVRSASGPRSTTIDGNQAGPVVSFISQEGRKSVLHGFTLQNGLGNYDGGGISISGSAPTITHNIIDSNLASNGGGIWVYVGSPVISHNTISHNGAAMGGGINIQGDSKALLLDNTIEANYSYDYNVGGGIALFAAGAPTIVNNRIIRNRAPLGEGGGVWIVNDANALFLQNLIIENSAPEGGGIYILGSLSELSHGLMFLNNTIAANNADVGSAVWAGGIEIENNFINNVVVGAPGQTAFHCDTTYDPTPPVLGYNDVWTASGQAVDGSCARAIGVNGNTSADPLFVSAIDYSLQPGSPAIDGGTNSPRKMHKTDLAGNNRIIDGDADGTATVDMGAYEFQ